MGMGAQTQVLKKEIKKKRATEQAVKQQRSDLEQSRQGLKSQIAETGAQRSSYLESLQSMAEPYTAMGEQGLSTLEAAKAGIAGILQDPTSLFETAQYKAQQKEMQRAVETSQAAKGMQLSGATLKELSQRGQELSSSTIDQALQRQGYLASLGTQQIQAGQTGLGFLQNLAGQRLSSDVATQQGLLGILGGQQEMYLTQEQIRMALAQAKQQSQSSMMGGILGLVGTIGGAYLGGPAGAAIGGQLGNIASSYGTTPGSEQTQMLAAQEQGF